MPDGKIQDIVNISVENESSKLSRRTPASKKSKSSK
jgi:hypothetical protein